MAQARRRSGRPETADDLSAAEYKVRVDGKIVMEPKEDIKERLGRSPGKGDALLLTFAYPVTKRSDFPAAGGKQPNVISEYDLYEKPAHRRADCDMSRYYFSLSLCFNR